ncbi:uncharacterized protein CCOS01_13928 [Colletotrichum costaricense]|uniref:Uncharacterized protein n=1 Tax=Colletotrichum costaricense TaxID=1209916 RepID=A0AAJ0DUM2_9PEZI|nr:uncharacterized protein CCOS01_13928 [Colletotrichum costaricense]KAK1513988.1 hypothetical protein CCOS01_13928 [Colletotrichum costaricense]
MRAKHLRNGAHAFGLSPYRLLSCSLDTEARNRSGNSHPALELHQQHLYFPPHAVDFERKLGLSHAQVHVAPQAHRQPPVILQPTTPLTTTLDLPHLSPICA